VVALNRAVVVSMVDGPAAALAEVEELAALALSDNAAEQEFLAERAGVPQSERT
jgi:predicted RNA polymerase sigma factor